MADTCNRILAEITFNDKEIVFKSIAVKTHFLVDKQPSVIIANRNDLIIKSVVFPLKSILNPADEVLKVNYQKKQFYIVINHFDPDLRNHLKLEGY